MFPSVPIIFATTADWVMRSAIRWRDQNEKLRRQIALLHSPQYIEGRIKDLNLGLIQPQPAQIWRLTEPPAGIAPAAPAQYAVARGINQDQP